MVWLAKWLPYHHEHPLYRRIGQEQRLQIAQKIKAALGGHHSVQIAGDPTTLFSLSAPERIVIDVEGAQLRTRLEQLATANTPITGLRAAEQAPGKLRIVIDTAAMVEAKSFSLAPNQQYGHRLVVDLFDQGEAPPAVAPKAPAAVPAVAQGSAAPPAAAGEIS